MAALGFNPWLIRWITFIYAGFWGGVSGLLYVYYHKYIHPTSLSITSSAEALLGVIAGGSGTLGGPAVGAALVLLLKNYASAYVERWNMLLGLVFLFIVLVMPTGIVPGFSRLTADCAGDRDERIGIRLRARNHQPEEGIRRPGRHAGRLARDPAGRTAADHRPERRRQDHAVQPDQRRHAAEFGTDQVVRHRRDAAVAPYKRAHLGLSRTYQIITLFAGDTLEHNVTLGLLGLRPSRWQMWRPLSLLRRSRDRGPPRSSMPSGFCIWPHIRSPKSPMARSAASNLRWRWRKSRAYCCSTNRWRDFRTPSDPQVKSLIASIPRETTVIMIEHDMDTALDLAETVTLLNYGRVIVDGGRDAVIADERTREVYLGV